MKTFIAIAALAAITLFAADAQAQCSSSFGGFRSTRVFVQPSVGFGFHSNTVVDGFGNVFEVNGYGQTAFRGNRFGFSQFNTFAAPVAVATPFVNVNVQARQRRGVFPIFRRNSVNVNAGGVRVRVR